MYLHTSHKKSFVQNVTGSLIWGSPWATDINSSVYFAVFGLCNDTVNSTDFITLNGRMITERMNWKGCERSRSWFDLRYCPGISWMEQVDMKSFSEGCQSLGCDLNVDLPIMKHKCGVFNHDIWVNSSRCLSWYWMLILCNIQNAWVKQIENYTGYVPVKSVRDFICKH